MNKFKPWKRLPIWLAVSAVIIIAGIVLMALLGFNTAAEKPENNQLEVQYDITVVNDKELQNKIEDTCETVFDKNGLSFTDMQKATGTAGDAETGAFIFYFKANVSAEKQAAVETALETELDGVGDIFVTWHTESVTTSANYVWRGAIAVGIVVALIYLGIRFGIGCALTGLTLAVHDAFFALAVLAIARIPVYAAAPVWYAAAAAFLSLAFWLVHCIKLRTIKKESQTPVDADTAVETAYKGAWQWIVAAAGIVAVIVIALGAFATAGVRAAILPFLVAVAAAAYSSLLLGPAIHVYVKRGFDKLSRGNKFKYVGKEKKAGK